MSGLAPELDDTHAPAWRECVRRRVEGWLRSGLGTTWVVAVSGGSDSVGLLRVLHDLAPSIGLTLSVAHLHHGVRGEQADDDAQFVAGLAASLGLPYDLGHWRPTRPAHFEADARSARYDWLRAKAESRGASAVAVGHTKDDQAETVLHRIVRGTGPRGLAGMPDRRPIGSGTSIELVRPILDATRADVQEHLGLLGQSFRHDPTNDDPSQTRARLRNDLIPRLASDYNPRVVDALARLASLADAQGRALAGWVEALAAEAVRPIPCGGFVVDRTRLAGLDPYLVAEVVRLAWRRAGWPERGMTGDRWTRIAALLTEGPAARRHVGEGVNLLVDEAEAAFEVERPDPSQADHPPLALTGPGCIDVPWAGLTIEAAEVGGREGFDEVVDLDRLSFPLSIVPPAPGDLFEPLGLGGRTQPLADFFRGRRVSLSDRLLVPIVRDARGIVWVVGHRIADRVRTSDRTDRRLGFRVVR